ncbi:hypothetical protein [Candidatus Enterococcus clewellii]|uniref:DUF4467 domain-containing protein n=1 Tax=Candidatus Enterococcus clewellii TaxID=1834193 RepID=A0A242K8Z1_9ENTE|nr:hypothetical protein [Enterococcus sp. 9E7_DIV0242]OTP17426.1 hypothetical protein A5888_001564 [Enterococcus sp. 9E7_DIV0242]
MKKMFAVVVLLLLLVFTGCSSSEAKDYSKVIDIALKGNSEMVKEYDWDSEALFEKEKSNIMVWEDKNNYYVYFRKNESDSVYGDLVRGDGYKISKSNDKWSSSPADRSQIMSYLDDNEQTVYEENNIELIDKDDYNMR